MQAVLTVWWKEVRENLRDRRTLVSALVFGPLFGPLILAAALNFLVKKIADDGERATIVAVRHAERAPNLLRWLESRNIVVNEVELDDDAIRAAVRDRTHPIVLSIPEGYAARLEQGRPASLQLFRDASVTANERDVSRLRMAIAQYGSTLARLRLQARGIDPLLTTPILLQDEDVSTPQSRAVTVLGMLSYLVLFAMLIGGMYLAIDATAGERERRSLEPLLTTPVRRESLIYGKILASVTFMLVSLVVTVVACSLVLRHVDLESFGVTARLDARTVIAIILVVAPLSLAAAGLMTVVASFTRSYREAQAWLGAVMLIPTLPLVFVGLADWQPTAARMAVPSLSQHFLMMGLVRGDDIPALHVVISVVSTLILGAALAWIAGRLYRRESLLG